MEDPLLLVVLLSTYIIALLTIALVARPSDSAAIEKEVLSGVPDCGPPLLEAAPSAPVNSGFTRPLATEAETMLVRSALATLSDVFKPDGEQVIRRL